MIEVTDIKFEQYLQHSLWAKLKGLFVKKSKAIPAAGLEGL
jgi:hypothetical protein